jgi:hypothetical protein
LQVLGRELALRRIGRQYLEVVVSLSVRRVPVVLAQELLVGRFGVVVV